MLRLFEGFDWCNSLAYLPQNGKWTSYGGNSPQLHATLGRKGSGCFRCGDNAAYLYRDLDNQDTWICGFAFAPGFVGNQGPVFQVMDGTTKQVLLYLNVDGTISVRHGDQTVLGTTSTVMSSGIYRSLELKVFIDNSSGTAELRVDGVTEVSVSGVDTQNSGNAYANRIALGEYGAAAYTFSQFDDVYVLDGQDGTATQGAAFNDFLGDVSVPYLPPSGDGNSSQLTGSDGNQVNNYQLVDEAGGSAPNDADYVESSNIGDKDTYAMTDLVATSGTVFAVQPIIRAQKTDAGTRTMASVVRLSGTEEDSDDITLASGFTYNCDIRTTKPGGGSWSISDVNSAEVGAKVVA